MENEIKKGETVYRQRPSPSELLALALKEFEGVTEENFRERIKTGVTHILEAKEWIDGNLMFGGTASE
jgi:hypothetical protein